MSCNILSLILALESVGGMTHSCITAKKKPFLSFEASPDLEATDDTEQIPRV